MKNVMSCFSNQGYESEGRSNRDSAEIEFINVLVLYMIFKHLLN